MRDNLPRQIAVELKIQNKSKIPMTKWIVKRCLYRNLNKIEIIINSGLFGSELKIPNVWIMIDLGILIPRIDARITLNGR